MPQNRITVAALKILLRCGFVAHGERWDICVRAFSAKGMNQDCFFEWVADIAKLADRLADEFLKAKIIQPMSDFSYNAMYGQIGNLIFRHIEKHSELPDKETLTRICAQEISQSETPLGLDNYRSLVNEDRNLQNIHSAKAPLEQKNQTPYSE